MGGRRNRKWCASGKSRRRHKRERRHRRWCDPLPPVVAFDSDGNVVAGWGNPSLIQTGPAYGYAAYLPHSAHGCYVDYQGYVWLGGNGDGIVQKYNPATANSQQEAATFVAQIGTKGMCDGTPTSSNPFSSCGETNDLNTSHNLLNEPPD